MLRSGRLPFLWTTGRIWEGEESTTSMPYGSGKMLDNWKHHGAKQRNKHPPASHLVIVRLQQTSHSDKESLYPSCDYIGPASSKRTSATSYQSLHGGTPP